MAADAGTGAAAPATPDGQLKPERYTLPAAAVRCAGGQDPRHDDAPARRPARRPTSRAARPRTPQRCACHAARRSRLPQPAPNSPLSESQLPPSLPARSTRRRARCAWSSTVSRLVTTARARAGRSPRAGSSTKRCASSAPAGMRRALRQNIATAPTGAARRPRREIRAAPRALNSAIGRVGLAPWPAPGAWPRKHRAPRAHTPTRAPPRPLARCPTSPSATCLA